MKYIYKSENVDVRKVNYELGVDENKAHVIKYVYYEGWNFSEIREASVKVNEILRGNNEHNSSLPILSIVIFKGLPGNLFSALKSTAIRNVNEFLLEDDLATLIFDYSFLGSNAVELIIRSLHKRIVEDPRITIVKNIEEAKNFFAKKKLEVRID